MLDDITRESDWESWCKLFRHSSGGDIFVLSTFIIEIISSFPNRHQVTHQDSCMSCVFSAVPWQMVLHLEPFTSMHCWDVLKSAFPFLIKLSKPPCSATVWRILNLHLAFCILHVLGGQHEDKAILQVDARLGITLKAFLRLHVRKLGENSVTDKCM